MEINIRRVSGTYHCESINANGNTVSTDGALNIGGTALGMRPMELVLVALGNCSLIDVVMLLEKQRQVLDDIRVRIIAEREPDKVPSLFTDIHLHFTLIGSIDQKKAERAVQLSMDKYCSVGQILKHTARIHSSFEILAA
ncbi:MAG: OsmC family protein [Saprospiraceae bacterium]